MTDYYSNRDLSLPDGWAWTTVGEIARKVNPGFPSGKHNVLGNGVPHLRPMNISPHGEIDLSLVKYVEAAEHDVLLAGDILFNNTNSPTWLGKTAHIRHNTNWAYSNHMTRIRLHSGPKPGWVAYALHHLFQTGFFQLHCRHHVNQASINRTFLTTKVDIPLPPVAEQHRIVEALEASLSQLDAGVAALKRLQAKLERYRTAVLKAACEGTLLPPEEVQGIRESPDYEPADMLLRRILAERRKRWEEGQIAKGKDRAKLKYKEPQPPDTENLPELPAGWAWATVDQTARQRLGKMLDKAKNQGIPRPYLRNLNVRWFGFDLSDVQLMRVTDEELENVSVREGDLVVCEGGEPGRAAVWEAAGEPMVIQKALHRVRPAAGVLPRYLAFRLAADAITGHLERYFTGSTIKHFTGQSLRSYAYPLPPTHEQKRIVAEVERRLSLMEEASAAIEAALRRADWLRQSILKEAFAGRLVPQDPNDEPASVLLDRIRAQREKSQARFGKVDGPRRGKRTRELGDQPRLPDL